ncbi:hypothetical protein [Nocardiopsis flavescens]
MEEGIRVRVDPGGRAVLRLGRWGYALRAPAPAARTERVSAVLGTVSLALFVLGWIPVVWLQATGGQVTGPYLAPAGAGLAGLLLTGLLLGWREIAGELLGYLAVFLLVVLFPLYFPLLAVPAVRRRLGGVPPSGGDGGGAGRPRRRAPAEREATYLYERLAGARLTGTGRRAILELEHRDGSTLTCTATGAAAAALREAALDRLEGLLPPGSGAPPRV